MVTVTARGEEAKKRLREQGVSPGRISSGTVTRTSSGNRTYRDASGRVTRTEEDVTLPGGERGVKTTTYGKAPSPMAAPPGPEQQDFYDATGRKLTPFEALAVQQTYAPMTSAQTGETVYVSGQPRDLFSVKYPYLAAQREAERLELVNDPAMAALRKAAKVEEFTRRTEASLLRKVEEAKTEEEFRQAQRDLRNFTQSRILSEKEAYGDLTPETGTFTERLTAVPKVLAGGFSRSMTIAGSATEALILEQEQKIRFTERTDRGEGNYTINVLKGGARGAGLTTLKIGRNVIGGAVTDTGRSPVQGALFAASGVLGGVVGTLRGAGITSKVSAAASRSLVARTALKGSGIGLKTLGYGALGIAGAKAAASDDPVAGLSRLGGQVLSFSGAYKIGETVGVELGVAARQAAPAIREALSNVKIKTVAEMGKKAAAYKGGKRVSPQSKAQLRKVPAQRRSTPKLKTEAKFETVGQEGYRITKRGNVIKTQSQERVLKSFSQKEIATVSKASSRSQAEKALAKLIRKQGYTAGKGTVSTRQISSAEARRIARSYLSQSPSQFGRAPTGKTPTTPTGKTPTTTSGGSQELLTIKKVQVVQKPTGKVKPPKLINDQKTFMQGDPANSRYAAQNMRYDPLRVDVRASPTVQTPPRGQTGATTPGFREGVTPGTILGEDRITYLKSGLRDLRGVALPGGNIPKVSPTFSLTPVTETGKLVTGIYISGGRTDKEAPPLFGSIPDSRNNVIIGEAIRYDSAVAEASASDSAVKTNQATDTTQELDLDQAKIATPFISPRSGGGSGRMITQPNPTPPPILPPTPPRITPPPRPRITRSPPPEEPPPRIFPSIDLPGGRRDLSPPGFDVEARIGGIFKRISRAPLAYEEAISFGSSIVGSSPAATFRVLKSSRGIGERFLGSSQIRDFEPRPGGIFVEKREKRINTPGELFGITRKGQIALKLRRVFGK